MIIFVKSHIGQYTRKDGAVVQAHDDNRQAAQAPNEAVDRLPSEKRAQWHAAHQAHHEIVNQHMPNAKREMDEHKAKHKIAIDEHAKHHALASEAAENGDNEGAVNHGRIAYQASLRSFVATANHKKASSEYEKHAKRADALQKKKEKILPGS